MKRVLLPCLLAIACSTWAREVSVQGKCETKTVPDRGRVQLQMEKVAPDVQAASSEASKRMDQAKAAIQKLGLKDLELRTTHYQVGELREWEKDKTVFKGYKASLGLEVTTSEITRLGAVMGIAAQNGLNGTDGFQTFLSSDKAQATYLECLETAAKDARKKAAKLADTLGADLGEVLKISEEAAQDHMPRPVFAAMSDSVGGAKRSAPSIEVASQAFTTTLLVTFKLK